MFVLRLFRCSLANKYEHQRQRTKKKRKENSLFGFQMRIFWLQLAMMTITTAMFPFVGLNLQLCTIFQISMFFMNLHVQMLMVGCDLSQPAGK